MTIAARPYLLDVTRLVARGWTRRLPTGIDRVCYAYLRHFRANAQAVVQYKGALRILTPHHSDTLFDMFEDDAKFRRRLARFSPGALVSGTAQPGGDGMVYINVSHTDFDLDSHTRWTRRWGLRAAYLIHDLIPITNPEFCRPHAVRRHRGRVVNALGSAAGIIVNSASTADELTSFARRESLASPPTIVAPLAGACIEKAAPLAGTYIEKLAGASIGKTASPAGTCIDNTAPLAGVSVDKTASGQDRAAPYFLCVGTIEPRKNHAMLLQLWRRLVARMGTAAPRLVIVGQWGANSQPVRRMLQSTPALREHVRLLDRCGDRELGRWLGGARALLMPTLAEGFGLPMVEALKVGTPVIASDLACFREIGQAIPTLLDPRDDGLWERKIAAFCGPDPDRERQLRAMGAFRASAWDGHFAAVESWLHTLPPRFRAKANPPKQAGWSDDFRPRELSAVAQE